MNNTEELQIQINDVYACPGHCPGCTLTAIERKTTNPDILPTTLINTFSKLDEYVKSMRINKVNVTYGIADHLMMSDEYLEFTFHQAADFLQNIPQSNNDNSIFYSSSMIGKTSFIEQKMRLFEKLRNETGQNVYMLAVLDPKNLTHKSFGKTFSQNIIISQEILGDIDLSINMSLEAMKGISPEALFEFAQQNKFCKININWTPTEDNILLTYMDQNEFLQWLLKFDELVSTTNMETSYRPAILKTIDGLKCKEQDWDSDLLTSLKEFAPAALYKHLHIDDKGFVYSHFEGIGDAAHNPRFGYNSAGNVNSDISLSEMLNKYAEDSVYEIFKYYLLEPCLDCEYKIYCANSGFHVYNKILVDNSKKNEAVAQQLKKSIQENNCPHTGRGIFSHYEKVARELYDKE